MRALRLTRMIASYWVHHMGYHNGLLNDQSIYRVNYSGCSNDIHQCDGCEGLFYYDGWNATFWYLLNVEWYRMQDLQFSFRNCHHKYEELRDFDPSYLEANFP